MTVPGPQCVGFHSHSAFGRLGFAFYLFFPCHAALLVSGNGHRAEQTPRGARCYVTAAGGGDFKRSEPAGPIKRQFAFCSPAVGL